MKNRLVLASLLFLALTGVDTDTQDTAIASNLGLFGGQASSIAPDPLSDTVYVTNLAPNGLFVSSDSGISWVGLPSDVNYGVGRDVTVDPDTGTAFATVGDTLLRSTDQGGTWEDITVNITSPMDNGLIAAHGRLLVGLQGGDIAVSDDAGASFTIVTVASGTTIEYIAASPDTGVFYCLVTNTADDTDALYSSTDVGLTWVDMDVTNNGMTAGTSLWKVAVNPTNGANLVTTSGVATSSNYMTTDGGDNWTAINDGSGLAFDSTGRLYVGFNYTDDPTASSPTWDVYATDTPLSSIYADQIAVDPEDVSVVFNNSGMGIAISRDRTATWEDSIDGVTSVKVYDISQTDDKTVVWLGANGGLAKTENFTADEPTWEYPVLPVPGTSNIHAVWVNPTNSDIVVAGLSTMIAYSTDGGTTWSNSTTPAFGGLVYEIVQSRLDDNTLYAAIANDDLTGTDSGAVFMSDDLGVTWTDLGFTDAMPAASLSIASDDTLLVGVGGDVSATGVYYYDGSSWSSLGGNPAGEEVTSVLIHPDTDTTFFATTAQDGTGNGTNALWKSTDSGGSWTKITDGLEAAMNLDTLTAQTTTTPITLYVAGQDIGLNGMVYKSSDGGETWGEYYEGLKQESFYAMFFDGLIAGNDRGLYDIKSRATLNLREKNKTRVSISLRDAATAKKLEHKKVTVYRKQSGNWKKIDSVRTNSKGKAVLSVQVANKAKLKAVWKPAGKDRREYAKATSEVLRFSGV